MRVHVLKKESILNRVEAAAERAAQLMAEIAGGEVLAGSVIVDELDKTPVRITVSPDYINNRLGMKISLEEMLIYFRRIANPYRSGERKTRH